MSHHELKTWPEFFDAIIKGTKTFEARKNDRNFKVGDVLTFREYIPDKLPGEPGVYTGRVTVRVVTYVMKDFPGVIPGYCVMGIDVPGTEPWEVEK
jgi:hypothetical protein